MATGKSTENYCLLKAIDMKAKIIEVMSQEMSRKGMTPTDIAKKAGMPTSTVSRILTGQRGKDPALITILRIYYALDAPLESLLRILLP
jgi:predicted transcriptional regulator